MKWYIHKNQREKALFITVSIVYIPISNTHLPEFLNILLYVEANPVWICRYCLYSAVIFNSKLDYNLIFMLWISYCWFGRDVTAAMLVELLAVC